MEYTVALLSSEYRPHICGGLGTHVCEVTDAMAGSTRFEMFLPAQGDYAPHPNVRIHEVDVPFATTNEEFWLRYCQGAVQAASHCRFVDLIHSHDWMTALAGAKLRDELGVPLVFNVHLPQISPASQALEKAGIAAADLVIVNSEAVRRELCDRDPTINAIEIVPNGVDSDVFHPGPDWPEDDGYLLFAGRLVPQKGVEVLLRAFSVVLSRCPSARLVIVGDGQLELYLQRLSRYFGISREVSFRLWQSGSDLIDLYQRAKLVVMPSHYEPFGIVALEAMACARPVVVSRVGGLPEIVEDGVHGFLTTPGDHLELAARLVQLIVDPRLCEQMGRAGREQAVRSNWNRSAERTKVLYREVVGRYARRSVAMTDASKQELLAGLDTNLRPIAERVLGTRNVDES